MMKKILGWVAIVAVLVAVGVGVWRWRQAHRPADVQYKTAPVEERKIVGRVTATGTLSATVTVQVGTQVSGRVQKLFADFNSPVKKGQLVAKIDPLLFQAAVEQADANYVAAQANVAKAKAQALDADRQYKRQQALKAEGLASQIDLDTAQTTASVAEAQIDVAQASLEQAKAARDQARVNLSYTNIVSPIDGTVISRNVDVGQTVAASLQAPVIFTIAEDLRKMQVNTNVAEADVGRLQPGMDTWFTVDAFPGQRFKGKISQIRNAAQTLQNVVTYDAVIDVDNTDLRLRPGMTANVTVVFAERDHALAVPNAALRFHPPAEMTAGAAPSAPSGAPSGSAPVLTSAPVGSGAPSSPSPRGRGRGAGGDAEAGGAKTIWVLKSGAPAQVTVQTGLSDGTYTEVTGGVAAGDQVIVDATVGGKAGAPSGAPSGGASMRRIF